MPAILRSPAISDSQAFCEHLFNDTTNGYISFLEIDSSTGERIVSSWTTEPVKLRGMVEGTEGRRDTYVSPNTYFVPKRSVDHIRQYRSLFIDLDIEKYGKHTKTETMSLIWDLVTQEKLPPPTMVVDSGRGFHVYFRIKNAPKQALQTFQELEDYLYFHMKEIGADLSATDSARVLRIPGTINSRNGALCKILYINNDLEYSMFQLRDQYLNYAENRQKRIDKVKEPKIKKAVVLNLFNSYSLHIARLTDIETLCKLRNYDVYGSRNFILHCFSYWQGICVRNPEQLMEDVKAFNNKFKKPLLDSEIKGIYKSTNKAVKKFIDYEQGRNSGLVKRVTQGMRDKPGYWYTNTFLINRLEITEAEQIRLKTIIDTPEKYRRRNAIRIASRKNENGLTPRQQAKQDLIQQLAKLQEQNPEISSLELSKTLKVTKRRVNQLLSGK